MSLTILLDALSADPIATLKSGARISHFIGLALGLGAATLLDLMMIRFLTRNKITTEHWHVIEFASKVVTSGLVLLWVSGLSFLVHYSLYDPAKLTNEKVWAKIAIVGILTLNGVFIHRAVLPLVRSKVGANLFDGLRPGQRSVFLASGAISATSWYVPLLLGALPQLNFGIPAGTILLAYGLLLLVAILATRGVARVLIPATPTVTLLKEEYEALLGRLAEATQRPANVRRLAQA
jgi:hypothetical protein